MTTPTITEFLTQPLEDEEEFLPPLESIADSLRRIAAALGGDTTLPDEGAKVPGEQYDALLHDFSELEAANKVLLDERTEVLEVIKKSTSKLANAVRGVLDPEPVPEPGFEPEPARPEQPAHDADAEEWRAYARGLGHQGADVDGANRSQIRTMLGIGQPIASS